MILVVGATGMVGTSVCRRLAERGIPTRALVRATSDPAKVDRLETLGVDIVRGDLRDPASLAEGCRDASTVICTVSSMPFSYQPGVNDITTTDLAGVRHLVDAARASGVVEQFVYLSFSKNLDLDFPLRNAKRAVEDHLRLSGLTWTILRPSCFMEVWLSPAVGFDPANGSATIYGTGEKPVSYISLEDVAEITVRSLTSPAARNAILELGGPEALSQAQAVQLFERIYGRPITVQHVPAEALLAQQAAATDPMAQSFSGLMRCVAAGDAIDMRPVLQAMPMALVSIEEFAKASRPVVAAG